MRDSGREFKLQDGKSQYRIRSRGTTYLKWRHIPLPFSPSVAPRKSPAFPSRLPISRIARNRRYSTARDWERSCRWAPPTLPRPTLMNLAQDGLYNLARSPDPSLFSSGSSISTSQLPSESSEGVIKKCRRELESRYRGC